MAVGLVSNDSMFGASTGHWYVGSSFSLGRSSQLLPDGNFNAVLAVTVVDAAHTPQASPILGSGNSSDFYFVQAGDVIDFSTYLMSDPANTYVGLYSAIVTLIVHNGSGVEITRWDTTQTAIDESTWTLFSLHETMPSGSTFVEVQVAFYRSTSASLGASDQFYMSTVSANFRHSSPANDDFLNAQPISGDTGSVSGDTVGAMYEYIPYDARTASFPEEFPQDVWYEYTNDRRGQVDFHFVASEDYFRNQVKIYRQELAGGPQDITMLLNTGQHFSGGTTLSALPDGAFLYNSERRYFIKVSSSVDLTFTLSWTFNELEPAADIRGTSDQLDLATRVYPATLVSRISSTPADVVTSIERLSGGVGLTWMGTAPTADTTGQAFVCRQWVESLGVGFRAIWIGWTPENGSFFYSFIHEDGLYPNWNDEYEDYGGYVTQSGLNGDLVVNWIQPIRLNQTPLQTNVWTYGDMEHGGLWSTNTSDSVASVTTTNPHTGSHSLEFRVNVTQPAFTSMGAIADLSFTVLGDKNKTYGISSAWFNSNVNASQFMEQALGVSLAKTSGGSPVVLASGTTVIPGTSWTENIGGAIQTNAWRRYLNVEAALYQGSSRPLTAGDRYYFDDIRVDEASYERASELRLTTEANDVLKTVLVDEAYAISTMYHVYLPTRDTHLIAAQFVNDGPLGSVPTFLEYDVNWNLLSTWGASGEWDGGAPIHLDQDGHSVVFVYPGINLRKFDASTGTFSTVFASGAPGGVWGVASNGDYVFVNSGPDAFYRVNRTTGSYYQSGTFNLSTQIAVPSRRLSIRRLSIDFTGDYVWYMSFGSNGVDSGGGHYDYETCFFRRFIDDSTSGVMTPTFQLDDPYIDGTDPSAVNFFTGAPAPSFDIRYVEGIDSTPALFKPGRPLLVGGGGVRGASTMLDATNRLRKVKR